MSGGGKLYKIAKEILRKDIKNQYNLNPDNVFDCLLESLEYYRGQIEGANKAEKRILIHNIERIKYFMYFSFDKDKNTGVRRKGKEIMALVYYFIHQ